MFGGRIIACSDSMSRFCLSNHPAAPNAQGASLKRKPVIWVFQVSWCPLSTLNMHSVGVFRFLSEFSDARGGKRIDDDLQLRSQSVCPNGNGSGWLSGHVSLSTTCPKKQPLEDPSLYGNPSIHVSCLKVGSPDGHLLGSIRVLSWFASVAWVWI